MKLNNVMKIKFQSIYGNMIALYNSSNTTENEARTAIETYGIGINEKVIIVTEQQFNNVFINKQEEINHV